MRFELLDGRVLRRPHPTLIHQDLIHVVMKALKDGAPRRLMVSFAQAVEIDRHNMPFIDVVGLSATSAFTSPVPVADLFLAIEVISDWSEPIDRVTKMRLYARAGIPAYWLIDALANEITLTEFRLGPGARYQQQRHSADQVVIDGRGQ